MASFFLCFLLLFSTIYTKPAFPFILKDRKKFDEKCWAKDDHQTLIGVMKQVIKTPLEQVYENNDYIQTFGCAYEDDDIEQNSIRAVYRAIDQSLRNRRITARDNIIGLLRSHPPRPDNLRRDYTLYVNLVKNSQPRQARYEVKVLELEVVPTFESKRAVWTRVITRYAYQEDFKNAPAPIDEPSEFVGIMELAAEILENAGKGRFEKVHELISDTKKPTFHPTDIRDLVFGDYISLFSEKEPSLGEIPAIYIGKGIYIAKIPEFDTTVLKFGEERLFGLRLDTSLFQRASSLFVNLQYHAPESVLQCVLLRFGHKKPLYLPNLEEIGE
ncbi:hypothetical protein GWO43_26920 [candidate division KSB1 bacterium]|nr:hypothetical protein [candidate division KSB1 bacterium]NIR70190.1 hypothetical protein [candidate division KSB1 bacterium]NIS27577.1 hypothetical protein [candidate division KSB1 bacterium]NIT74429.1 hypothetical protein [candidate division KSB1 bacterium]NIU28294.1 hypothetical protein [candidate division KSB1 bacterium]